MRFRFGSVLTTFVELNSGTTKRYQKRIIPLLFKKCDLRSLSWTLPQFQMIDFTKDYWEGCDELLRVWNKRLMDRVRR